MTLELYAHPFSSYCQKVLIALYENATPFTFRLLGPDDPATFAEFAALWPMRRMPVLVDGGRAGGRSRASSSSISALHHPGPVRLIPADPRRGARGADARPLLRQLRDDADAEDRRRRIRAPRTSATRAASPTRARCSTPPTAGSTAALAGRDWAAGDDFSLADCAAAPSLFYADWVHPIADDAARACATIARRLLARPSFARAVDEARPYRPLFPPGAPDRD